ncbi:NAD/NADP transhydrogenase alpha subunit-like protein (plasmid) [Azospirillum sp. 412522]|nr:NAD/NADP transhydrogenase alpha subunit-like protein [Azospirillum sp. 412522]
MGRSTDIVEPSDHRCAVVLTAGVPKSIAVPAHASAVLFSASAPFWVQYDEAATLPTTDVLDGAAPELSPNARRICGIASLGLVSSHDCTVSLSFFQVTA